MDIERLIKLGNTQEDCYVKKVLKAILDAYENTKKKNLFESWETISEAIHDDFNKYFDVLAQHKIIVEHPWGYGAYGGWFVTLTEWAIDKLETS